MQKRTKLEQQLLVAGCAGMIFASTGCRSAMPKWNMFSWRSAPSAETLAGNGPTITYPTPPGESATPEAIASVAGGTSGQPPAYSVAASGRPANSPITGFDAAASGADAALSATNRAAAQANGFNVASNRSPSGVSAAGQPGYAGPQSKFSQKNSSVPAIPAGYQFGTSQSAAQPQASGASQYSMPSSYPAPGLPNTGAAPPSGYSLPTNSRPTGTQPRSPSGASQFGLPSASASNNTSNNTALTNGFELPDSMLNTVKAAANHTAPVNTAFGTTNISHASNSQPFTPKPPSDTSSVGASTGPRPSTGFNLPGNTTASTPSFSTASASLGSRSSDTLKMNTNGGYAPGSTAVSGSYPTTSGYPSTGTDGSFYR